MMEISNNLEKTQKTITILKIRVIGESLRRNGLNKAKFCYI